MTEIICSAVTAISVIIVAVIANQQKKSQHHIITQTKSRSKESKLSMDMMYACCILSRGTAVALKNNHFNSEVDHGIDLVDKATDEYNKFLRETTADSLNI